MYRYETEKPKILTDEGQRRFLMVRDNVMRLLGEAGCVRMSNAFSVLTGDCWEMMSHVDRLVEIGEIREISPSAERGQDRIFIKA